MCNLLLCGLLYSYTCKLASERVKERKVMDPRYLLSYFSLGGIDECIKSY